MLLTEVRVAAPSDAAAIAKVHVESWQFVLKITIII